KRLLAFPYFRRRLTMHSATEPKRRVLSAKMPSRNVSPSIARSIHSSAERRECRKQFPDLDFQRLGDFYEVQRADVSFSPLDAAVIGTVNVGEASKLLLGKALLLPQPADLLAKQNELRILHWASSISAHGFLLHGLWGAFLVER